MAQYAIEVARPIELLAAVVEAYCGESRLSLEGELDELQGCDLPGTSHDQTAVLKRSTPPHLQPKDDFAVIPVNEQTLPVLLALLPRIGLRSRVYHVEIESAGSLVFGAYDSFHPRCAWVDESFGEQRLEQLVRAGVVRAYALGDEAAVLCPYCGRLTARNFARCQWCRKTIPAS